MKRSRFTPEFRWRCWALACGASFVVMETVALARDDIPGTLTVVGRGWLGLEPRRPRYLFRLGLFYAALGWLAVHLSTGRFGVVVWSHGEPVLELGEST